MRLAHDLGAPSTTLLPWIVADSVAGYVDERRASLLADFADTFIVADRRVMHVAALDNVAARTDALEKVSRELDRRGELTGWREERYAVRNSLDNSPLLYLERAAARFFGIRTEAAHLNGITRDATMMWIARRSAHKPIDPGQLDNLVGGGVGARIDVQQTIVKEAWEEAGIDESLARSARCVSRVEIARMQNDGLQRETIHIFDLTLPDDFVPINRDGEVAQFTRMSIEETAEVAGTTEPPNVMTADAALVVADWLLRHGHVPAASPEFDKLDALRRASFD